MIVFNVGDYGGNWQAALADALAANGVLEFPEGVYTTSQPLIITTRIEVRGVGWTSQFKYTGTGAAVRLELVNATESEGCVLSNLRITGNNTEGQGGVEAGVTGVAPRMLRIERLKVDGFLNGVGISLKVPINSIIEQCTVQGARECIVLRTPCGCSVRQNWVNYWANSAIKLHSIVGDGLGPRNNNVELNVIHGSPAQPQNVGQDRAGIRLDGVSTTTIRNNYLEGIASPPSGAFVGHGIWLQKTAQAMTQNNEISETYFGPNTTGDCIRLDAGASHTAIRRGLYGAGFVIRDNGNASYFDMVRVLDIASLAGTSSSRRGTLDVNGAVTQLHP